MACISYVRKFRRIPNVTKSCRNLRALPWGFLGQFRGTLVRRILMAFGQCLIRKVFTVGGINHNRKRTDEFWGKGPSKYYERREKELSLTRPCSTSLVNMTIVDTFSSQIILQKSWKVVGTGPRDIIKSKAKVTFLSWLAANNNDVS